MKRKKTSFKLLLFLMGITLMLTISIPLQAAAKCGSPDCDENCKSKCRMQKLKSEVQILNEKIEKLEKNSSWAQEDIGDLSNRLDAAEMHTATDKVSFGVYFRTQAHSIHYENTMVAPQSFMGGFFIPYNPANPLQGGFNGATLSQIQQGLQYYAMNNLIPPVESYDTDNDIIYTNKFRLDMKAKVNENLSFAGRLAAYKVFGDSTELKFNQGSLGDVTFDGTSSSLPRGDTIHLERAYFVYKDEYKNVPMNLSIGRRPSTDGPPLEYGNYSEVGGSPLATIINWQFDGASLGFGLENITHIPGFSFKLCYGIGFESDWGNSYSNTPHNDLSDVHLFGFISDFYDNGKTNLMFNYAHAWDITDGFTGTTVMPMIVSKIDQDNDGTPEYYFEPNTGGFVSRIQPMTNIGDWDAASLLLRTNLSNVLADIDFFLAGSMSHTSPSQISNIPFYEMMGMGLLNSNGELKSRDGYSIYTGILFPMPLKARLGLEYNWGSEYWFNFTGAEDSLIGSKLAVRGDVYEAYYIQPIVKRNFFVKVGTQYYDYEYTGSGNPLGAPVKISEVTSLDALNPVVDKVWNYYASVTFNF
ncbi:MAG: DUF3373 domain-containing protein [Desulfobacteraceae bacterium]|nr:DUF3373 family protein [Desulfobacteraceae bacterium]MBC2754601.1 DUF3373 domain-containing protein [Desulfobacteraceae bacterium]